MSSFSATNTRLVAHYIQHRLLKEDIVWRHGNVAVMGDAAAVDTRLLRAIETMGDVFENKYKEVFSDMCQQLQITGATARSTFATILDELFLGGIRWGRIVALISFAGSYSLECERKGVGGVVDEVCDCTVHYLDNQLKSWILQNGGWDGFVEFSDGCHSNESPWPPIATICKYAVGAVGLITLATLFSSRS